MKPSWCGCDGHGNESPAARVDLATPLPALLPKLSRRQALLGAGLAAVGWMANGATALADIAVAPNRNEPHGDVLVVIFLRGGADGLNIVVPYGEDAYHRHRRTLGVAAPKNLNANAANRALDLDGFFGLHPELAPLHPLYQSGQMSLVHAVGSGDHTRSHFEAMLTMERGVPNQVQGAASGWLARHLDNSPSRSASPLRAVAFSSVMPDSLRGATDASALNSLADFRLEAPPSAKSQHHDSRNQVMHESLAKLYAHGNDAVTDAGRETLAVLDTLNRIDPAHYKPGFNADYPTSDLGTGLRQVACLLKGHVGLEVACLDHRGPYLWDTHVAQSTVLAAQISDLGKSVAAFATDLGPAMKNVTVVVMTEFGRRLQENGGLGTDHGRASMMMLLGGGVIGGKVFARWPGLEDHQLEDPGDLKVTTDYRDVLAEVLAKRIHRDYTHNGRLAAVFPNYDANFPGFVKS